MSATAPYDARAVANYMLDLGDEKGVRLTQVSLLKLLYFSHGWYLALKSKSLLKQEFEAWPYGPVIKVVRDEFKQFKSSYITDRAYRLILNSGNRVIVDPLIDKDDKNFICNVFKAYHIFDAWELSEMTHEKGSPWDRIWNSTNPVGRLALRIKNEEIRAHFLDLRTRMPHC